MNNFLKLLLVILVLVISQNSYATHAAGGYLTYECIGGTSYKVTLTWYRDCSGANYQPSYDLKYESQNCSVLETTTINFVSAVQYSYCGFTTTCNGGSVPGYEIVKYETFINLGNFCDDWVISVEIQDRNSVDFVTSSGSMRLEAHVNNTLGCFNSIDLADTHVIIGCVNNSVTFTPIVVNPFNWDLDFELICPLTDFGNPVTYSAGQSCQDPFPNNSGFFFDSNSGAIGFVPTASGVSYLAYKINFYDNNGDLIGWIVRDIQIVILSNCLNDGPDFFELSESSDFTITGVPQGQQMCVHLAVVGSDGDGLSDVYVDFGTLPNGGSSIVTQGNFSFVEVCFWDDSHDCTEETYTFTVHATDLGCPQQVQGSQEYTVEVEEGIFCQENLYYSDRNSQSGSQVPAFSRASEEIWVGDDLPVAYTGNIGPVEIHYPVIFEAGVGINIPACTGGGYDCIDFVGTSQGDIHFYVKPNNCNPDCNNTPMEISVDEIFDCHEEHLIAHVTGGTPPYTYNWYKVSNSGQIYQNGYLGSGQYIDIHDEVSQVTCGSPFYQDGLLYYKLVVSDAGGFEEEYYDDVLGTRAFYVNPNTNVLGSSSSLGDFLASNSISDNSLVVFEDQLNDISHGTACGPPFYGATEYTLEIWPRDGSFNYLVDLTETLEGGSDWSFDNGEIYWNGYIDNDLTLNCVNYQDNIYDYRLILKNCIHTYEELGFVYHSGDCYEGTPITVPAGMMISQENTTSLNGQADLVVRELEDTYENQFNNLDGGSDVLTDVYVFPNPSTDGIYNLIYDTEIIGFRVFDSDGKLVYVKNYADLTKIDLSSSPTGIYYLLIEGEDSQKVFKLIRN